MKTYNGKFHVPDAKIALVTSRFNDLISKQLTEGAKEALLNHEIAEKNIELFFVPGAFEIPLIAKMLAEKKQYDAIITLGVVIRGETPHFEYISSQVASKIAQVSYDFNLPVIFGVLTTNTLDEALQRAGGKVGNKGYEAALSAIEMISLIRQIQ